MGFHCRGVMCPLNVVGVMVFAILACLLFSSENVEAKEGPLPYGFDFSKMYPSSEDDPTSREQIMKDMVAALSKGEEIVYRETEEEALKLWIFRPTKRQGTGSSPSVPAIVFIHGGGWGGGHAAYFSPQAIYFSQRGIVSVSINYRLTRSFSDNYPDKIRKPRESYMEDCIRDAKSAIRWLRLHAGDYGIDPARIVVAGGSAGAHVAASLGPMDTFNNPEDDLGISPLPNAMVLFNPAIDFVDSEDGRKIGMPQAERLGIPIEKFSPAHLVDATTPPTLVLSGELDTLIPPSSIHKFLERMETHDRSARFVEYAGKGHGFFNYWPARNPYFASTLDETDKYLVELGYLKGKSNVRRLINWYEKAPRATVHDSRD